MIWYFDKSRKTVVWGGVVSAFVGASLVWLLYQGKMHTKVALLSAVAILSVNIVFYFARIIAYSHYQEILLLLYKAHDPEVFLEEALPLFEVKLRLSEKIHHVVHVANAYMLQGKIDMAIDLLESQEIPDKAYELKGLVVANLGTAYLLKEEIGPAKESIDKLKQLRVKCKEEFKKKSRSIIAYQQIGIGVLEGDDSAKEILEKDYEQTTSLLHKKSVEMFLRKIDSRISEI